MIKKIERNKAVAVLLAIFFSILSWVYTWKEDRNKFWLTLLIGLFVTLILGVTVILIPIIWLGWIGVYIWVIIDQANKKKSEYYIWK